MNTERTNQGDQGLCQPDGVTGPGHQENSGGALHGGEVNGEGVVGVARVENVKC